ncbi:hypothetical protein P167DRAFT_545478 [Morchella conica CCBAS932]|uniref:Aminoglycoside phosphotransferase domain-containing protein n=1 Tax=Morchella conica CCBAS932 TaxID=1392247 RepID=A0A3N4KTG0_9PEZI|nr:hypothetical protein P167DRAFT_545478 [Morchella conica CCBAS932]
MQKPSSTTHKPPDPTQKSLKPPSSTWKDVIPSIRLSKPVQSITSRLSTASSSSSSSSSDSSIMSRTSTIDYGHETFPTFSKKILELLHHIGTLNLPSIRITPKTAIDITRMPGGNSYRIIGITLTTPTPTKKTAKEDQKDHYILRLPRHETTPTTNLLRAVSTMYHLEKHTPIRTPITVVYDPDGGKDTSDCPLSLPYILQTRLPGKPLAEALPEMSFPQRCAFVRQLVNLLTDMDKTQFPRAGVLVPAAVAAERKGMVVVDSFDIPGVADEALRSRIQAYPEQTTRDMLLTQLETWRLFWQHRETSGGEAELAMGYIDRLIETTREMERYGCCLGDNVNVLYHPALTPQKIFVQRRGSSSSGEWVVSGVLGWDETVSVPRIMAHRAPSWLWRSGAEEGWQMADERHDCAIPASAESAEVKKLFEIEAESAIPRFLEYAYRPRYRMVRRLCWFAVWGVRFEEDVLGVAAFLREWDEMKKDPNLGWAVKGVWGEG